MQHTWRELVERARVYVNDDHREQQGWITDDQWLELAKVEYHQLYRKWTRMGVVRPPVVDTPLTQGQYQMVLPPTGQTSTVTGNTNEGVLAIVGVAEDMVSYMRMLTPGQPARGAYPAWVASGEVNQGKASTWMAYGVSDNITVELSPRDTGSNYVIRWVPTPPTPLTLDDRVDLPFGTDERVVLGLARRALLKESGSSTVLERLIMEADAEVAFAASGRLDNQGPRVRRVRPAFRRQRFPWLTNSSFPSDVNYWYFP